MRTLTSCAGNRTYFKLGHTQLPEFNTGTDVPIGCILDVTKSKEVRAVIIDIYKSTKDGNKYLAVPKGTRLTSLQVPDNFDPDLRSLSPFKTRLELNPARPQPALDQDAIIAQIEAHGFAVHGAKIEISVGGG